MTIRCRNPGPRRWLRPAAGQAQNRPGAAAGEGSLKPRVGNGTQEWRTCGALRRPGPALAQDGFISVRQRMQGVTSRIIPGTSDCIGLQFFTRSSAFECDLRASPVAAGAGADKDVRTTTTTGGCVDQQYRHSSVGRHGRGRSAGPGHDVQGQACFCCLGPAWPGIDPRSRAGRYGRGPACLAAGFPPGRRTAQQ
ncbi:hypothetical protein D3C73_1230610 [compost metagenome]